VGDDVAVGEDGFEDRGYANFRDSFFYELE